MRNILPLMPFGKKSIQERKDNAIVQAEKAFQMITSLAKQAKLNLNFGDDKPTSVTILQ